MKKKVLAMLLCIGMVGTMLMGCGSGDAAATQTTEPAAEMAQSETKEPESAAADSNEKKWKLGYSSLAFFDEGCKLMADGFLNHAAEFPNFDVSVLDGNSDMNTQIATIDTFWNNDVDVVSIQAYPGIESNLYKFYEAGKPIIFIDFYPTITDDIKDMDWYFVGSSDYSMGEMWAEYLADVLPENGTVCELLISVGQQNSIDRSQGLHDKLAELRPDVTVLDSQSGDADATTSMNVTEDWIQRFGADGIDAIVPLAPSLTVGVVEALKAEGLAGKITVVSSDENLETATEYLTNNYVSSILYLNNEDLSLKALEIAQECMEGNPPEQREYRLDRKLYTIDNLDEYGK